MVFLLYSRTVQHGTCCKVGESVAYASRVVKYSTVQKLRAILIELENLRLAIFAEANTEHTALRKKSTSFVWKV